MKKEWVTPDLQELIFSKTAGGGVKPTSHDGFIYQLPNGVYVEGYDPS